MDDLRRTLEVARRQMNDLVEGVRRLDETFSRIEQRMTALSTEDPPIDRPFYT